ncbi:MAG: flagellar motor switch protein FliN [Rhodocyclaceae bacterium]|nr:flagellar motor switch protein FliN [Rhodocyclaceae bacterium]MDZ4215248.1 flagellar motor switch protein FliN [Rhodocyclaceae bacterium]
MSDEVKPDEEAVSEDDWAAAMGEQTTAEGESSAEDDWAAAMGEQAVVEKTTIKPADIFNPLSGGGQPNANHGFELILDIPVSLTVELGRTKISIRNLLQLAHGSVVELDGLAGEPMDVLVNGTLIAQGEVVVVNDKFGIRLTDIITPQERLRKLNK